MLPAFPEHSLASWLGKRLYGSNATKQIKNDFRQTWAVHSSIVLKKYIEVNLLFESFWYNNKKKDAIGILSCCVCEKGGVSAPRSETQQQNQIDGAFKLIINIPDKNALLWLNQYMAHKEKMDPKISFPMKT